jgi:hypothetical protein
METSSGPPGRAKKRAAGYQGPTPCGKCGGCLSKKGCIDPTFVAKKAAASKRMREGRSSEHGIGGSSEVRPGSMVYY